MFHLVRYGKMSTAKVLKLFSSVSDEDVARVANVKPRLVEFNQISSYVVVSSREIHWCFWMANVYKIAYCMHFNHLIFLLNQPNTHKALATLETFITPTCFNTTLPFSGSFEIKFKKIIKMLLHLKSLYSPTYHFAVMSILSNGAYVVCNTL